MKHSIFSPMTHSQLLDYLRPAIYIDVPDRFCSLLMGYGRHCHTVPIEVARMVHRQIGEAISRAEEINEFKLTHGYNPDTWSIA